MHPELLARATAVAARHHDLARAELGGEVLGVWLIGSAILGDLTPASDIDTITLTTHPLDPSHHPALTRVHERVHAEFLGLRHDTTYLSVAALAAPPVAGLVTPHSVDGRLRLDEPCKEVHPVTWLTLPQAIPVGGIPPEEVRILADRAAAEDYARANLQDYWAGLAVQVRQVMRQRAPDAALPHPEVVPWLVLGAPRLVAFLAGARTRGPVPSKSEAGRWVIDHLPPYAELARRCLRARAGHQEPFVVTDAVEAADLVSLLVHGHG